MKLSRFDTILDAYGAQPEHWPERERAAALALVRTRQSAADALARTQKLDAVLLRASCEDIDTEQHRLSVLRARIVGASHPLRKSWLDRWLGFDLTPLQLWPSVAGLALAMLLGFGVGIGGVFQIDSNRDPEDISVLSAIDFPVASE